MKTQPAHVYSWAMLACLTAAATSASGAPISFTPLGNLGGVIVESIPTAISANGKVVVGNSVSRGGREAFRWTRQTGMVGLGDLPGGDFESRANAISADGSVIVGRSSSSARERGEAFRWTADEGMVGLANTDDEVLFLEALGVSVDGSVIVGRGGFFDAIRWTATEGAKIIDLGPDPLLREADTSRAWEISADGSVIVGIAQIDQVWFPFILNDGDDPFRIEPELFEPERLHLSADGTTVAGGSFGTGSGRAEAFRWTETAGAEFLSAPPGIRTSAGLDISADSRVIVGLISPFSSELEDTSAAIWDEARGWQKVEQILTDAGVDTTDWILSRATAVSANGRVVAGTGINPNGDTEAWLAVIEIPEPSAIWLWLVLTAFAFACLILRRKPSTRLSGRAPEPEAPVSPATAKPAVGRAKSRARVTRISLQPKMLIRTQEPNNCTILLCSSRIQNAQGGWLGHRHRPD